jgi:hypothetical protein
MLGLTNIPVMQIAKTGLHVGINIVDGNISIKEQLSNI